jgi:hypothetical protein
MKRVLTALLFITAACAEQRLAKRQSLFDELEQHAGKLGADGRAPSDMALYRRARADAEALPAESPERAELETTARAYLAAAIATAERDQLSAARLELSRRLITREAALSELDHTRLEADRALDLTRARDIAAAEIARAYTRLGQHPARRPKLSKAELESLARALTTRAELILIALEDTALDEKARAEAQGALARAKSASLAPNEAFEAADAALVRATLLLAAVRASHDPGAAEKDALMAGLVELGLPISRHELGLAVAVGTHSAAGASHIAGLCRVALGHPHGKLAVLGAHPGELPQLVSAWREAGCDGARLEPLPGAPSETQLVVFTAY